MTGVVVALLAVAVACMAIAHVGRVDDWSPFGIALAGAAVGIVGGIGIVLSRRPPYR